MSQSTEPRNDLIAEVTRLRRLVMEERGVDLIRLNPFLNLVHINDAWYAGLPAQYKNKTVYDLAVHDKPAAKPIANLDIFFQELDIARNPLYFLLAVYSKSFDKFAVCDIGSQYGTSAMMATLFLRSLGSNASLFSFEPGIAGALTPLNYQNNGFPEIKFFKAAAGPLDGHAVLYREFGHSENNRIVNPNLSRERDSVSVPVECVRIDTVMKTNNAFGPTVAKIDTQGAEPGVIMGAVELIRHHPV